MLPLPQLRFPLSGTLIADAFSLRDDDVFAGVPRGAGPTRRRRVFTVQKRRVGFELMLPPESAAELDRFHEEVTDVGSLAFSILIPDIAPGRRWWRATFGAPYRSVPVATRLGIYWRVSGEMVLEGEGFATAPAGGDLAAAFALRVTGSAAVTGGGVLAATFGIGLHPVVALAARFTVDLLPLAPSVPVDAAEAISAAEEVSSSRGIVAASAEAGAAADVASAVVQVGYAATAAETAAASDTRSAVLGGGGPITWDTVDKSPVVVLSNSNRTATSVSNSSSQWANVRGSVSKSSGKWYFEVQLNTIKQGVMPGVGVADAVTVQANDQEFGERPTCCELRADGSIYSNQLFGYRSPLATGDTVMIAFDAGAGKVWFGVNGAWSFNNDPASGDGPALSGLTGALRPAACCGSDTLEGVLTARFSQFTYTPPAGFSALA